MVDARQIELLSDTRQPAIAATIAERLSQELIFGLVGPVGSGVSTAGRFLAEILSQQFGYTVAPPIKPSEIIRAEAHRVGLASPSKTPLSSYINEMQTIGNALRKKYGADYLAEKAVEKIVTFRREQGGYVSDNKVQLPTRTAYIVDSIKNIEEWRVLRQIYGRTFCVFGIFAPDDLRKQRLIDSGIGEQDVQSVLDRDQGEVMTFGQMTRKVFVEADFFLCNDQRPEELRQRVARYLDIIFDTSVHTPTKAEAAMYKASAAASNSACMSRQVGAAIVSAKGELISVGWNDVPRFGGGLYSEDDNTIWDGASVVEDKDRRCFKWGGNICHNETRRDGILNSIAEQIMNSNLLKNKVSVNQVRSALAGTDVEALTEFSRSIHAEMEAILCVAREGRSSLSDAVLYTTTYPCHNCARHIVAAGIRTVIYIEPYRKSLATVLHSDSITEDSSDKSRVVFRQYDGVAPRHILQLFRPEAERKSGGRLSKPAPQTALPVFQVPLDGLIEYETKVIVELDEKEHS